MRPLIQRLLRPGLLAGLLVLCAAPVQAYVGPGLGLGAIAVILGIVISVLIALVAIVWYPLKRRLAARRRERDSEPG